MRAGQGGGRKRSARIAAACSRTAGPLPTRHAPLRLWRPRHSCGPGTGTPSGRHRQEASPFHRKGATARPASRASPRRAASRTTPGRRPTMRRMRGGCHHRFVRQGDHRLVVTKHGMQERLIRSAGEVRAADAERWERERRYAHAVRQRSELLSPAQPTSHASRAAASRSHRGIGGSFGRRARLVVCVCRTTQRPPRRSRIAVPRPMLSMARPPTSPPNA